MCKRSITALVWLLIFAIPAQGVAAAAVIHCGAYQHSGAGATQVNHALDDHAAVAYDDSLRYADHQVVLDIDASGFEHDGYAKCSACAACCVGLGLPSGSSVPLPSLPSVAANCDIFTSALEVISTGPERPPRLLLV